MHLDSGDLAGVWSAYKEVQGLDALGYEHSLGYGPPQPEEQQLRNQLALHYTSLVKYVASRVKLSLPVHLDVEDLASYGMFGLLDAIEKYDLGRGNKFETYGMARIQGAIYDEIRKLDWIPRSVHSKAKTIATAKAEIEELNGGADATSAEIAAHLGMPMEEYWILSSKSAISQVDTLESTGWADITGEYTEYESLYDPASNPEDIAQAEEVVGLLSEAIDRMDERSKTILVLYYLQEMNLAEIGHILGVTESRVCQLQSKVLTGLRETLGQGGLAVA